MKNITNFLKHPAGIATSVGVIGAVALFGAILAHAQVTPTVSSSIHDGSHTVISTALIGSNVHDNANVASTSGPTPTGTVDFTLYSNTSCSGTASSTQSAVGLNSGGSAESGTTTITSTGLSYKVHYNGQGDVYAPTDGPCEPLFATSNSVTILGTLSSTTVLAGTSVTESAILNNSTANATGTVAYRYFTDNGCTSNQILVNSVTVLDATVPTSNSVQFNTPGTFYWRASYSGDQYNNSASTLCLPVQVLATSTPPTPTPTPTPPPSGTGSISGTVYSDVNHNLINDTGDVGLAGFTINLYGGMGWWKMNHLPVASTATDSNGNYSFGNLAAGTYSIEEVNKAGWIQLTGDYKGVVLASSTSITGKDFANASTTNTHKDKGNHFGEFFKKFGKQFKDFWKHQNKELKKLDHGNKKGDGDNDDDD